MRQLKLHLVFHLFLFPCIIWLSNSILCVRLQPRFYDDSANSLDAKQKIRSSPSHSVRLSTRQTTTTAPLFPPGGVSSGGAPPPREPQNLPTPSKSSAENSTASSEKDQYEGCIPLLSSSEQSNGNPVVPSGSSNNQPESKSNPSSVSDSRPSSPTNQGSSQNSGASGTGSQASPSTNSPQASSISKNNNLPPQNTTSPSVMSQPSAAGFTSNTSNSPLPSPSPTNVTSNPSLPNQSSSSQDKPPGSIGLQKSQGGSVQPDDQRKIVIAGCVILAVLLILGTLILLLRRKKSKSESNNLTATRGLDSAGTLQARPGEFGKRGTVLVGRGLESRHGLPSSGGWLDTRVASTERLVSTFSSRASSSDVRRTQINPRA